MQSHSPLRLLADLVGIIPEYLDQSGKETRITTDETRQAILRIMGFDVSTPERARASLEELERREWDQLISPVRVIRRSDPEARTIRFRVGEGVTTPVAWSVELRPESGEPYHLRGTAIPEWGGAVMLELDDLPPIGYHTLRVAVRAGAEQRTGEQSLILVPDACPSVMDLAGRDRVFGVIANLYTVRSARNWGIGDLSDLGQLLQWTAEQGGAFVGVNPLHALRNRGMDVSPYSPVSRVFRNPIYLDVTAVPELDASDEARRMLEGAEVAAELESLRNEDHVEYERVMELKWRVLQALYRTFREQHAARDTERGGAFDRYVREQGEALTRFATFEALVDHFGDGNWREWPEPFRNAGSMQVAAFREEHESEVDFQRWIQFELDRQLGQVAARGQHAGLSIGLYQDLAIGSSPSGADAWTNPDLFLSGVSIGAPPDQYSASGQNWGLPPLNPLALRADAYRFWIGLVRASMRHGGALRIDHAMGLFRQFWIPDGMTGKDGAYIRFPADDLLGILALEATRRRAAVVGEDLGTVTPEVPPTLHGWGVLSSRVFYFEREGEQFRPAADYEPMALATANTHDMPTLAGFWRGRDIELKREVEMIGSEEEVEAQRRERAKERVAILELLAAERILPSAQEPERTEELRGAVHAFLCRTPAMMVGFNLDDLVGEVEPVNLPGVPPDRFSSWTRKLSTPLEALGEESAVRAALRHEGRGSR